MTLPHLLLSASPFPSVWMLGLRMQDGWVQWVRVRAARLHQWLVFQAFICGEINAGCWWVRYVASDSSPPTHKHSHQPRHACTPGGWTRHWLDQDPLAAITEILTCYFNFSAPKDAKQFQLTGSDSFCVLADTWCTSGTKGGTCLSLRMVTRPTPGWSSSSWIMNASGKRYENGQTMAEIHRESKLIPCLRGLSPRWDAGKMELCRWCSQYGRGTTPTGTRMRMRTTSPSSPWRRSLSSSWTT